MFTLIADSRDRFSDFTPYVASLNNDGVVAFQAALRSGGTGVFTGSGGPITAVWELAVIDPAHAATPAAATPVAATPVAATPADPARGFLASFCSHPDIDRSGALSVYADLKSGGQGVFRLQSGHLITIADTGGPFTRIGPLGPTMNETGWVAFRADTKSGNSGIFVGDGGPIITIADTRGIFSGFQGLPVINNRGTVVFRADLKGGGQGIYTGSGGSLETLVDTRGIFGSLGLFPGLNDAGTTVFSATLKTGEAGIFTMHDGKLARVASTADRSSDAIPGAGLELEGSFESFRGALINNAGTVFLIATSNGGALGIYGGPDPLADRILSIGDPLFGSTVADFALNPVSVNDVDQLAIRVRLADDRQLIIRADPVG